MAWKKSPPDLIAAFENLVAPFRGAERHLMFGYPAAFVKGNMFAGLHEDRLVLRLGDEGSAQAKRHGARDFEAMRGRVMKGWIAVPGVMVGERAVRGWIEAAYDHTRALPAKRKKTRTARA